MKGWNKIVVVFAVLLVAFLCKNLLAGQVGQPSPVDNINSPDSQGIRNGVMTSGDACPTREELITKTRTLQMPFIANNGQVDEQVRFYAKTFGGMVFVTKEGEIVYSLPEGSGRDVPDGASQQDAGEHGSKGVRVQGSRGAEGQGGKAVSGWHGQAPLVRADAEFVEANVYSPLLHTGNANCPPYRVLAKSLLATYFPELQKGTDKLVETTRWVVCPSSMPPNYHPHSEIQNPKSAIPLRGVALKETIIGAKMGGITGEQPSVTTVNYFTGNDKSKWKTNVSTYNRVNLGEVYKGIELSLKAYGDNVEKLFCVKPGASPEFIKVQLDGSKSLRVNQEGQLEADTELGLVKFTRPIAYQEIDGKRVEVACAYTIADCGVQNAEYKTNPQSTTSDSPIPHSALRTPHSEYSFTVASYDRTKDLIIDPLLASTYLGGSDWERGWSLALDTSGDVYVTGRTHSTNFPTTSGAYDTSFNGSGYYGGDVFVSKLNGGLTSLLASTYLGGSEGEQGSSLTLDTSGNVYVTGYTRSTDFPTTSGAYDTSYNGSVAVFVSKLNSGLTSLLASTYLGGSGDESGWSLTLDTSGNVYVMGSTNSTDFPTTSGAYDTSLNGYDDVFVSKLNSGLTSLLASTYLGGSSYDEGWSLTLDTNGNVYVTGETYSTNFPTTSGAYDTSFNGSNFYNDVFVSKLNSGLTSLLASTYLGGFSSDYGTSLALDTSGNIYVTGVTTSTNFPTTSGAYDTSFDGHDVFVSKLNSGLTSLLASTSLGGSSWDDGWSLTLDTSGNVYVTGGTYSTNFPTTSGAYDTSYNDGHDVFVSKLDGNLSAGDDTTPPTVVSTSPVNNAVGVAINSVITAAFSEEMDASTITTSTFYLNGGVTGTVSYGTDTATFTPYSNLSNATTYTATITTGVKDVAGNNMAANYTWSFTTVSLCKAKSITAAPNKLTLSRNGNGNVTITVKGDGDCLVEGVTVTAMINGNGKKLIGVSPSSQETDASGQAVFAIDAKDKKGTAVVKFKASGLNKSVTVQVKVR